VSPGAAARWRGRFGARILALAGLLALAGAAHAQHIAMRLEMLTERIAKLHAQVGQGILVERSRRSLREAITEFDADLRQARAQAKGAEARDNYLLLDLLWKEYRRWAARPATRDNAKKLAERAEEVAWVAAKGARMILEPGRTGTGRLALEAAHAATLAQRLARLHLLRRWGVKPQGSDREIPGVAEELVQTLDRLRTSPLNTPEIQTEIQSAQGQLGFLMDGGRRLRDRRVDARTLEFIAKSSDHVLESLERAARLYEGEAS